MAIPIHLTEFCRQYSESEIVRCTAGYQKKALLYISRGELIGSVQGTIYDNCRWAANLCKYSSCLTTQTTMPQWLNFVILSLLLIASLPFAPSPCLPPRLRCCTSCLLWARAQPLQRLTLFQNAFPDFIRFSYFSSYNTLPRAYLPSDRTSMSRSATRRITRAANIGPTHSCENS